MNAWLVAATLLLLGALGCAWICLRASPGDRLVAFELSATIDVLVLMLLAQGFGRTIFMDLAVALALLSLAGGLVFAHFLERWV